MQMQTLGYKFKRQKDKLDKGRLGQYIHTHTHTGKVEAVGNKGGTS